MKNFFLQITLFFIASSIHATNMYSLSGVKNVYPVVEIMTSSIAQEHKQFLVNETKNFLDNLEIDHANYDPRAFAILIKSMKIKNHTLITVELFIGEEVRRISNDKLTYAATYIDKENFILENINEIEEQLDDALSSLFNRFEEQYIEENKKIKTLTINSENFAQEMGYETSYDAAVSRAKKEKKDIMLVLVTNYCPWCRKFEQKVLLQEQLNKNIQKNYIPLILNKEKDSFPQEFNKSFSPMVYFINFETLKSYKNVIGYNNKEEFFQIINNRN